MAAASLNVVVTGILAFGSYLEENPLKKRKIIWENFYHSFMSMSCMSQSEEKPCASRVRGDTIAPR